MKCFFCFSSKVTLEPKIWLASGLPLLLQVVQQVHVILRLGPDQEPQVGGEIREKNLLYSFQFKHDKMAIKHLLLQLKLKIVPFLLHR